MKGRLCMMAAIFAIASIAGIIEALSSPGRKTDAGRKKEEEPPA